MSKRRRPEGGKGGLQWAGKMVKVHDQEYDEDSIVSQLSDTGCTLTFTHHSCIIRIVTGLNDNLKLISQLRHGVRWGMLETLRIRIWTRATRDVESLLALGTLRWLKELRLTRTYLDNVWEAEKDPPLSGFLDCFQSTLLPQLRIMHVFISDTVNFRKRPFPDSLAVDSCFILWYVTYNVLECEITVLFSCLLNKAKHCVRLL